MEAVGISDLVVSGLAESNSIPFIDVCDHLGSTYLIRGSTSRVVRLAAGRAGSDLTLLPPNHLVWAADGAHGPDLVPRAKEAGPEERLHTRKPRFDFLLSTARIVAVLCAVGEVKLLGWGTIILHRAELASALEVGGEICAAGSVADAGAGSATRRGRRGRLGDLDNNHGDAAPNAGQAEENTADGCEQCLLLSCLEPPPAFRFTISTASRAGPPIKLSFPVAS